MNQLEMRLRPRPGEELLYVCLTDVEKMTVSEALNVLQEMSYTPELRYLQTPDGQVHLYALLKQEQHEPDYFVNFEHSPDEWDAIAQRFGSDKPVYNPRGMPRREPIAA